MRNVLVVILMGFLLISCDGNQVFDTYKKVPSQWVKTDSIQFNFQAPDTINKYNMFINLRNTNEYEFSNLHLIVSLKAPYNNKTIDTLAYEMAKPNGEWLGVGMGTKENKLFFKEAVRFRASGTYQVSITHAMRKNGSLTGVDKLNGVTEVGFRIEKTQK